MLRKAFLAIALVAAISTSAMAATSINAGNHVFTQGTGLQTFAITGTSDAGEQLSGIDLYLVIDALGPLVTNVDIINGTVFEPNNVGQLGFGLPEYEPPSREVSYYTTTAAGVVPTGIVAFVTIDTNSAPVGQYSLSLDSPSFGPSAVYNDQGLPGGFTDGSIELVPEPGTVVMGLFGAAGLAAVAIRRRRARNA